MSSAGYAIFTDTVSLEQIFNPCYVGVIEVIFNTEPKSGSL